MSAHPKQSKILAGWKPYPRAKAPDHWSRKPRAADMKMTDELEKVQLKDRTPGGSSHGIKATKKNMVIGVVFHISLFYDKSIRKWCTSVHIIKKPMSSKKILLEIITYAKAVQFSCCCRLDHRILLTALGMIQANAIQAPKKWNWRSVTVATATPIDTIVRAKTCTIH